MKRQRLELALERLGPGDWERFEKFSSEFLVSEYPNLRTVASPAGDQGRDAFLFSPAEDSGVVLQYSVSGDWNTKVLNTAQRIKKTFPKTSMLIFISNQTIGAKADKLRAKLHQQYGLSLDIRDRSWFADRVNLDSHRETTAEMLARDVVDPYLSGREIVDRKAQAFSSVEARAALVYLALQWEDDSRDKGLTKLSFEALVLAALRGTDAENRLSRAEVQIKVRSFLPTHPESAVDKQTDLALTRLRKTRLSQWQAEDEFCLAHTEKQRLNERFAVLEKEDLALQEEILQLSREALVSLKLKGDEAAEQDLTKRVRRVLEKFFLNRGELFASAVTKGQVRNLGFEVLNEIATKDLTANAAPGVLRGYVVETTANLVRNIVVTPGIAATNYLRNLADAYTLMAFLRETPDVQGAVSKMFSHGELWLDTTVVLPLFAEELLEDDRKNFTAMIKAATESGLTLRVTPGVIEEVERHMNRCMTFVRNISAWKGPIPFLYDRFISSGRSANDFSIWLETFRGSARPNDDIADYLEQVFGIKRQSLESAVGSVSDDLRIAVKEEWTTLHERRRSRNQSMFEMDPLTLLRLVDHDVENYVGVIGLRLGEEAISAFGFKHWFLTLDHSAYEIEGRLKDRVTGRVPPSPVLSADFLINYLAFGPVRSRISRDRELALPIVLDMGITEVMPQELLEIARKVREESGDLSEFVIRRRVRDKLDESKRRLGSLAMRGMEGSGQPVMPKTH